MTNPTEKAPLALYERVRRAMKDHAPEHDAHCECPCCEITSALENYADEIAALEAKLGQVSAERSHWYRVAQAGPTLTDGWRARLQSIRDGLHRILNDLDPDETVSDLMALIDTWLGGREAIVQPIFPNRAERPQHSGESGSEVSGAAPTEVQAGPTLTDVEVDAIAECYAAVRIGVLRSAVKLVIERLLERAAQDRTKAAEGAAGVEKTTDHEIVNTVESDHQPAAPDALDIGMRSAIGSTGDIGHTSTQPDAPLTPAQRAFYEAALEYAKVEDGRDEAAFNRKYHQWRAAYRALSEER